MRSLVILLVLLLTACSAGPSYEVSRFTGVAVARSGLDTIDWTYPSRFEAEAAILQAGPDRLYVLNIAVTRSDRNYPKISSVWVPGREVQYTLLDERRVFTDRQEVGYITLNRATFETAAQEGFDLSLISPRTSHHGHVPAEVFARALAVVTPAGS
ncbi:MAG: hypothetical protein AAFX45_04605 [Pseudomonadota bacterium]